MPDSVDACPQVAVLLCSYNGGKFLAQQLESIAQQEGVVNLTSAALLINRISLTR